MYARLFNLIENFFPFYLGDKSRGDKLLENILQAVNGFWLLFIAHRIFSECFDSLKGVSENVDTLVNTENTLL